MQGVTRFARVRVVGTREGSVDVIRPVGTVGRFVGRWQDE
jgi:hypothetical protein